MYRKNNGDFPWLNIQRVPNKWTTLCAPVNWMINWMLASQSGGHGMAQKARQLKAYQNWLVVWNMAGLFFHISGIIMGISSSRLTNSIIFQRGRYTTKQKIMITYFFYLLLGYKELAIPMSPSQVSIPGVPGHSLRCREENGGGH